MNVLAFLRWRGAADAHRFEHADLHREVHATDVVCFQELFLSDAEQFFDKLAHPHKRRDHNRTTLLPLTVGGSGLGVASHLPIQTELSRGFARPHVGSERFARKGMLHARIELAPGHELDVITTHMQSGYNERAGRVRIRQLRELRELADEVGDDARPLVICGDFNVCGLQRSRALREYEALRETLHDLVDLGADADEVTFDPHPGGNVLARRFEPNAAQQRIDYILFREPAGQWLRVADVQLAMRGPLQHKDGSATHPSDHFALRAEFDLTLPQIPGSQL